MKLPTYRLQIDWRVALGQVFLTALGVALALAGDAWWTHHQEHVREMGDLHAALDAARTNEKIVRQAMYEDSITLSYQTRMRDWLDHKIEASPDSIDDYLGYSQWWSDAKPLTGVFAMIVESGDINFVRDPKLRVLLPTYLGEIESRVREAELFDNTFLQKGGPTLSNPDYRRFMANPEAAEAAQLRKSVDLSVAVETQMTLTDNAISFYRIMLRNTVEVRQALESYLHEKPVKYPAPRLLRDSF